jgi:hypothetical protein
MELFIKCSQERATGNYPELDESSPHLFLSSFGLILILFSHIRFGVPPLSLLISWGSGSEDLLLMLLMWVSHTDRSETLNHVKWRSTRHMLHILFVGLGCLQWATLFHNNQYDAVYNLCSYFFLIYKNNVWNLGFRGWAASNKESYPVLWQTFQLPTSGWMCWLGVFGSLI